ncbi:metallophosphoesterase family protein [Altericista sp. CCNU0014]|uniref:metallophosphoesterase family protein n=1 Tax=Altericista sp. CCNU0014 TaxID=3082949 RepID=UPI003851362C
MQFISDPAIADKIRKMKQRVRWQDPLVAECGIDQTQLVIADGRADEPNFSFLVIGDSGSGPHLDHHPQREVAELMLPHQPDCRFTLHTGDVVYLTGSSEYYPKNFIEPYRELLAGGDRYEKISYREMVFQQPFFPVLGNHDYYDLPLWFGLLAATTLPLRSVLESKIDFDLGWRGSDRGDAYARAFLDYLKAFKSPVELRRHLDRHYTAKTENGDRCLRYEPGTFTRLPNRYYSFRQGGIDFFALDSCTFNDPIPLPKTHQGDARRRLLEQQRDRLEREKQQFLETASHLDPNNPYEVEQLDDLQTKLSQTDEVLADIKKQLAAHVVPTADVEQLDWLKQRLIASWNTPAVRGRVLYFHHPPYVTESTKWHQAQTLTVRQHLRRTLDEVARVVGPLTCGRPLVDLVLNGHAHCLEHLKTLDTGHADSHIPWIICGGSGFSLRRQRLEGPQLLETFPDEEATESRAVASSQLFIGRNGKGSHKRRPYSCLRIDVREGAPPQFTVRPLIAERYRGKWHRYEHPSFAI